MVNSEQNVVNSEQSGVSPEQKLHYSTCTLCEAMCGIEVVTQGNRILSIKGDKDNPFSEGHICPKASALKDLYDDPDRLKRPIKKVGDEWQEIPWSEAFDYVAEKLHHIQSTHGKDAVGVYLGNPNAHNMGAILFGPYFYRALESHNRYSATSVDQLPHHIVSRRLFGHMSQIPIPDIDRTQHFVIIGGNPLASNGSIMTVPNVKKRLKGVQKRGGKVVVIDPKRTDTADLSCEHHFIRPGSDVLLLLAMLHVVFEKQLHSAEALLPYAEDLLDVEGYVKDFSPETVSELTGIKASQITKLVTDFCEAESAVCYGRMGASVQAFGTLTQYLIMLFNMLTGNLDRQGGMMFTQPAADILPVSSRGSIGGYSSRVRGLPAFAGEYPVACLAEEILTPGEGQIKAMVIGAGNPVVTTPNTEQLERAFSQLDFVVSVDFYISETSRHADIILPPVTPLERDHYDVVFHNFAVRNYATYSEAVVNIDDNQLTDWQIYLSLAERLDKLNGKSTAHYQALWQKQPKGVIDDLLKSGQYGAHASANGSGKEGHNLSLDKLKAHPHGIDLGPLQSALPNAIFHENKKIDLDFDYFMPDIARVKTHFFDRMRNENQMVLIGRRHIKTNNSWLHNSPRMVKGNNRCTLQLHPADAAKYQVQEGDRVKVTSRVGELFVEAEITDSIMPGVVSIPHGWGHNKKGIKLGVASQYPGVNTNILTDEMQVDTLSGNGVLNGVPVSLERM
ncbi:molybdopterin oxidoreductase family protein [Alteromonas stellipolaris]|uniref:molybdopterin oxidoreductase family protein n=1 Tax=Alteromonas stellipolaris TaxID=233316 RepID=UPI0026E33C1D|nr:molybdopterin oxidoreductase family protein [Alteromonas stellipolaris]MDO6536100.1 molybdopterin oxidoreductase family protein [Alteromonas stellipolaris]MDO6628008.1 molybdopterin oxidoreductase family protein [Alteromonas stellipolaris]